MAALVLGVVLGSPAQAQAQGSLGAAFRPQTLPPAPGDPSVVGGAAAQAASAPADDGASGLRVLVIGPKQNLASIDGRMVRVGDRINGMRVTQINANGVVLSGDGGAREEIKLNPGAEKKPANSTRLPHGARP